MLIMKDGIIAMSSGITGSGDYRYVRQTINISRCGDRVMLSDLPRTIAPTIFNALTVGYLDMANPLEARLHPRLRQTAANMNAVLIDRGKRVETLEQLKVGTRTKSVYNLHTPKDYIIPGSGKPPKSFKLEANALANLIMARLANVSRGDLVLLVDVNHIGEYRAPEVQAPHFHIDDVGNYILDRPMIKDAGSGITLVEIPSIYTGSP